jgi:uncharacterized protein
MLINLSETLSVKNKVKHIEAPLELESFKLDGDEYKFVLKDPVSLILTNLGEKRLLIEGKTRVSLLIPCSRCLEDVEVFFDIFINKEIDFKESAEDRTKELDETNYISGYNLDVDVLIYDEILIDFPLKVLCDEDCKGICNVCGTNHNNGSCDCESTALDPRMSVIRDIFKNSR